MNLIKHMEAVFVATVALAVSGSWMLDNLPQAHAQSLAVATVNAPAIVVVKAKRMTAAEKQLSLQAERAAQAVGQM
ncbi:hypothetical protein [Massilia sp. CF038]|uniref:hypothetical protein n=1 Tax=Massilia sp. CF038 TaxID=1881045 RepID=UPI00091065F9|nr:hypothetical protein [Massilia sp. CF038]SHG99192.1 hypothetical protein SAMN05428948_2219 [Massilia sp. CF038]